MLSPRTLCYSGSPVFAQAFRRLRHFGDGPGKNDVDGGVIDPYPLGERKTAASGCVYVGENNINGCSTACDELPRLIGSGRFHPCVTTLAQIFSERVPHQKVRFDEEDTILSHALP